MSLFEEFEQKTRLTGKNLKQDQTHLCIDLPLSVNSLKFSFVTVEQEMDEEVGSLSQLLLPLGYDRPCDL